MAMRLAWVRRGASDRGAVPGCQGTSRDLTNVSPRTGTGLDNQLDEVN
jgi:hypothetical protein